MIHPSLRTQAGYRGAVRLAVVVPEGIVAGFEPFHGSQIIAQIGRPLEGFAKKESLYMIVVKSKVGTNAVRKETHRDRITVGIEIDHARVVDPKSD
jgi:hypothetical protein